MDASPQIDSSPGDVELVRQVAAGSETAFAALYDRYAAPVFRAALRLQRDHGVAEDVVQETFLTLWNRAELFDPARGSLGAWLTTIARNRAVDRSRTDARRIPAQPFSVVADGQPDEAAAVEWMLASGNPIAVAAPEPQPDDVVEAGETRAVVGQAIADLRDDERRAILLAYRDGLTQSEIAAVLGWPLGTVKTRSRRGLRRLRQSLMTPASGFGPGSADCATCP